MSSYGSQPDWQAGPQPVWQTAEGEPWPEPGEPTGSPGGYQPGQADRAWQSDQHWPVQPLAVEPASGQWSAQLRRQAPAARGPLSEHPTGSDELWAMISYLGIPFLAFLAPLLVYLVKFRSSPFARLHATQALNLSVTVILYNVCALIVGGLLALDSVTAALALMVPLLTVLWLITLSYLVLAGTAAGRGADYRIPGWLCATLVH